MAEVSGWLRQIVVLLVFVVFLELLLPRLSMKNFIRVVVGLLMMVTILRPLIVWIHGFHPMEVAVAEQSRVASLIDENSFWRMSYEQGYACKIERYLAEEGIEGCKAEVRLAMENIHITIKKVNVSGVGNVHERVKEKLCRQFELSGEVVEVQ